MSDDLVKRLRSVDISWHEAGEYCADAADLIEVLDKACKEWAGASQLEGRSYALAHKMFLYVIPHIVKKYAKPYIDILYATPHIQIWRRSTGSLAKPRMPTIPMTSPVPPSQSWKETRHEHQKSGT